MLHRWCLLALCTLAAQAHYSALTVTDDGNEVYFTTTLVERTRAEPSRPELRLFAWKEGAVRLVAERGTRAPVSVFGSGDGVELPQVSGDGKTLAYTLNNVCHDGSECMGPVQRVAVVNGETVGERTVYLSRNGRYAVLGAIFDEGSTIIDRQSGQRRELPGVAAQDAPVASDGTVVVWLQTGPAVWTNGQTRPLALRGVYRIFGISPNGDVVIAARVDT